MRYLLMQDKNLRECQSDKGDEDQRMTNAMSVIVSRPLPDVLEMG